MKKLNIVIITGLNLIKIVSRNSSHFSYTPVLLRVIPILYSRMEKISFKIYLGRIIIVTTFKRRIFLNFPIVVKVINNKYKLSI